MYLQAPMEYMIFNNKEKKTLFAMISMLFSNVKYDDM